MIYKRNDFAQRYDTRQAHPYGYNCFIPERCPIWQQMNTIEDGKMHKKRILRTYWTVLSSVLPGSKLL